MPGTTIVIGVLLGILGMASYLTAHVKSPTALIPSVLGAILIVLGVLARDAGRRKHAMHAAAALATLGFLAAAGRLISVLARGRTPSADALVSMLLMLVLTGLFVVLCVRSFIAARRRREAESSAR